MTCYDKKAKLLIINALDAQKVQPSIKIYAVSNGKLGLRHRVNLHTHGLSQHKKHPEITWVSVPPLYIDTAAHLLNTLCTIVIEEDKLINPKTEFSPNAWSKITFIRGLACGGGESLVVEELIP